MKNFRDLTVWDKAHQLTLATYRHTTGFPLEERYGLISQIPANIAEGWVAEEIRNFIAF